MDGKTSFHRTHISVKGQQRLEFSLERVYDYKKDHEM